MTKHVVLASFALAAVLVLGSFSSAAAQPPLHPTAFNGFPAPRCSRPPEQEAARIQRLVESLEEARAAAEKNPLLLADVGYYQAELAASRRCTQSVAAR